MRLNALCEESSHWETGPNGMILASGIGEIGARRAFEAMCYFDSLMRPRWLEMLHRNCRQSSPPAQNPRPASRFRLDKRDVCCRPMAYSRHPTTRVRTASASVLRPPRRAGAGKAVFSFDSVLQFVVERFDKLGDQLWRRRQCLWAWCLSVYRRDSASLGPNALWLASQPVRCHRTSAAIARDILPDVNWP